MKVSSDSSGRVVVTIPSLDMDLANVGGGIGMVSMMRTIERSGKKTCKIQPRIYLGQLVAVLRRRGRVVGW